MNSVASSINTSQSFRFGLKWWSAWWKLTLSFCFLNLSADIDNLRARKSCVLANNFSSESTTLWAHNILKCLNWDWFLLADGYEILQSNFIKNFFHDVFQNFCGLLMIFYKFWSAFKFYVYKSFIFHFICAIFKRF